MYLTKEKKEEIFAEFGTSERTLVHLKDKSLCLATVSII